MTQQQTLTLPTTVATQETRRQHTVARLLGAQSFGAIHWQQLMQDGTLVELHIGRCGFTTRIVLEDMGLQIDDEAARDKVGRWMTLGEKRLLPEAYMKNLSRLESRARATLKEHAFRTELGSFVPITAYEQWRVQTEALRAEYLALRDDIIEHYDELVRQVLDDYEVIAADTYQRLRVTHPELVRDGQQQFVTSYTNRIASQIPAVDRIHQSFSFRFFRVPGTQPLGVPVEALPAAQAQPAVEVAEIRASTEQRMRQRALLQQDMRHDAQQRINSMLDEWLTTIVGHLRVLVYDASIDVLATLQRRGGEGFSGRSTMQLNNLLTQIRSLNFFGDTEIDQMMTRIEHIVSVSPAERQRSVGEIQQTLRAIATTTRATLLDLGEDTRAPRPDLGIAAVPTNQLVKAARAELRLPPLDPARIAALALSGSTRTERAELTGPDTGSLWQFIEQSGSARSARSL